MNYIVVESDILEILREEVIAQLNAGFTCVGGISLTFDQKNERFYSQALVK